MKNLFLSTEDALKQGHGDYNTEVAKIGQNVCRKLQQLLYDGKIKFDWNGHHRHRIMQPVVPSSYTLDYRKNFGYEEYVTNDVGYHLFYGLHTGDAQRARLLNKVSLAAK
jgi:hypothetical protein